MPIPTDETAQAIEAAVFRRLVQHLDENKEVQNIELMNLAGFCRNCLSKWYVAAAEERGWTWTTKPPGNVSTACPTGSGSRSSSARRAPSS